MKLEFADRGQNDDCDTAKCVTGGLCMWEDCYNFCFIVVL